MLSGLDHVVVGVRDLDAATRHTARLLGREAVWRGTHPPHGTANALFRLDNTALELLAPQGAGARGEALAAHLERQGEGLLALAFATPDAEACAAQLGEQGLAAGPPLEEEGVAREGGARRRWRRLPLRPEATRGVLLFAVERLAGGLGPETATPATPQEDGVTALDHVVVRSADLEASGALYGRLPGLRLALDRRFEARGVRILFFRIGGVTLELAGPLGARAGEEHEDRLWGLAWRVADVAAAAARIAKAGLEVSEVRDGAKRGTRVCTVRSGTHGVATLLIGPEPGA